MSPAQSHHQEFYTVETKGANKAEIMGNRSSWPSFKWPVVRQLTTCIISNWTLVDKGGESILEWV